MDKKWIIRNPQKSHTTCYCNYCYHSKSSVENEDIRLSTDEYMDKKWIIKKSPKNPLLRVIVIVVTIPRVV